MRIPSGLSWRPGAEPQHPTSSNSPLVQTRPPQEPSGTGDPTQPNQGAQDPCGGDIWWMMGLMFLVMYFLLIRPQQKQEKQLKTMRSAIKRGDKVVTTGGMHGTVTAVTEQTITVKTDQDGKTKMTFDVSAVGRILQDESPGDQSG